MEAVLLEKSTRQMVAEELADFVTDNDLNRPWGGEVVRGCDRRNRAYYGVAFSRPGDLDGIISVYSHKYFVLKFKTRLKFLPAEDTLLFKSKDDLLAFMKAAFVDLDSELAITLLAEVHAES